MKEIKAPIKLSKCFYVRRISGIGEPAHRIMKQSVDGEPQAQRKIEYEYGQRCVCIYCGQYAREKSDHYVDAKRPY
jgi:hypothetical protein